MRLKLKLKLRPIEKMKVILIAIVNKVIVVKVVILTILQVTLMGSAKK